MTRWVILVLLLPLLTTQPLQFCVKSGDYFVYSVDYEYEPDVYQMTVLVEYANDTYIEYHVTTYYENGTTDESTEYQSLYDGGFFFIPCGLEAGENYSDIYINTTRLVFDFGTVLVLCRTEFTYYNVTVIGEWLQCNGALYYFYLEGVIELKLIDTNTIFPLVLVIVVTAAIVVVVVLVLTVILPRKKRVSA